MTLERSIAVALDISQTPPGLGRRIRALILGVVSVAVALVAAQASIAVALARVDDRGSPLPVDQLIGAAKLTASDPDMTVFDFLGVSLAASSDGSVVVAGARNAGGRGAAYVFVRPAGGWSDAHEVAKLTASDGHDLDRFGDSVAISSDGSTIVVGADGASVASGAGRSGAVYVFTSHNAWSTFSQIAELRASDSASGDLLGATVAVSSSGAAVVAGAPENGGSGAAYVFTTTNAWSSHSQAKLTAPGGASGDRVGDSVAIDSDATAVAVGAPGSTVGSNPEQGIAYVFLPTNGSWVNTNNPWKLTTTTSGGAAEDELGFSIAMSGDGTKVIAGAPTADGDTGAAYVFVKPSIGTWQNESAGARLAPSDATTRGRLGYSVAISSGSTAVAGAPEALGDQGAAYVFTERFFLGSLRWRSGTERARLTASDGAAGDQSGDPGDELGTAVAISGDGSGVFAGAPLNGDGNGAVYAFRHPTATTITCQPASIAAGRSTSCTANVDQIDSGDTTPTGTVSFMSDSPGTFSAGGACSLAPTGTAGDASCQLSYTPTAIGSGAHTIGGSYGADATHAASDATSRLNVTAASSSTTVSCRPSSLVVNDSAQCTATVDDTTSGNLAPAGTVDFISDSGGSFSSRGSCTLANTAAPAVASCQVNYVPTAIGTGTHTITATFAGDAAHDRSQRTTTIAVNRAPTTTTVACQPLSVLVGHATVCSATVTDAAAGAGSRTPAGAVAFTTGAAGTFASGGLCTLASTAVPGVSSCQVGYTPSAAGSGTHAITVIYGGDGTHTGSSGSALIALVGAGAITSVGGGTAAGPGPKVSIRSGKLTSIDGIVSVQLSCPARETFCAGTLSIYLAQTPRGPGKRPRRLGQTHFHISGGQRRLIEIHLSARVLRPLKRSGSVRVTVVVRAQDQARRSITITHSATLAMRHNR